MTTIFGTDGIRSLIGKNIFTDANLTQLAHAISLWVTRTYGEQATILLGSDTRNSCSWIKHTLIATLNRHGHTTYDAGIIPTPAICLLTSYEKNFNCGIIISASHNPWDYNGVKIYDRTNGKITNNDELLISQYFYNPPIPPFDDHKFGTNYHYSTALDVYKYTIVSFFKSNFLRGIRIVLDCAHGATTLIANEIFTALGATTLCINSEPNGININEQSGALHPEKVQSHVIKHNAHVGFAFDGDGDRVIAVSADGSIKDGDDIIALLATHPYYNQKSAVVSTTMANCGLYDYLKNHNKELIKTDVGDKYITSMLKEKQLTIGGEQSGHIIIADYLYTGDGIFAALKIIETMILTNNMQFSTFTKYPQVLMNVEVTEKKALESVEMQQIIKQLQNQLDNGRILVRYSGTEPLLRVMVETSNIEKATTIAHSAASYYKLLLNQ